MALLHDDVCITKRWLCRRHPEKDHGFAVLRGWHHKSPYLCFIMLLASKRIISLRSRSRAPTKWPARWLLINYLIFYHFWSLSLPAIFQDLPIGLYIDIAIFIQVCEPVSQKVCGTVEVAVPRYHHHHQTTSSWPQNVVMIFIISPRPDKCAPKPRWLSPLPASPSPARQSLLLQAPLLLSLEASSKSVRNVGYQ